MTEFEKDLLSNAIGYVTTYGGYIVLELPSGNTVEVSYKNAKVVVKVF